MTEHHPSHSNVLPEVEVPLDLRAREHATRARQMQAEAVAASVAGAWQSLSGAVRASAGWLLEQRRRAQTRRALMACSDRTLADIGIPREYIHLAAKGVDLGDPNAVNQGGWRPRPAAMFERLSARGVEQRRVYRELMAYTDRELEEIGVRRSDIPTIARAA